MPFHLKRLYDLVSADKVHGTSEKVEISPRL